MAKQIRIFAVDPGPEESAYVILAGGVPIEHAKVANAVLLSLLKTDAIRTKCRLTIEMIAGMGMAVGQEVFETVYWIGRFAEASGGEVTRIKRHEIKIHICRTSRAKDANIRQALIDRYGPGKLKAIGLKKTPGPLYGITKDCWSALALAVTFQDRYGSIKELD